MRTFDAVTLRLITAIAREGSLTKAAAQERIAPSAVSRRIADLEQGLGTVLLHRHSSGLSLTPAGRAFAGHCQRLLETFAEVEADLAAYATECKGELRIVAVTSALMHGVPALVAAFERACPEVVVTLQEVYTRDAMHALRDGRADLAVVAQVGDFRGLETTLFAEDPIWAIGPRDHPVFDAVDAAGELAFAAALRYPVLGFREGGVLDDLIAAAAEAANAPIQRRINVTRFGSLRRCVEAGLGLAFLPQGSTQLTVHGGTLRGAPLSDAWAKRSLVLCCLKDAAASPLLRRFTALLRETQPAPPGR